MTWKTLAVMPVTFIPLEVGQTFPPVPLFSVPLCLCGESLSFQSPTLKTHAGLKRVKQAKWWLNQSRKDVSPIS